VPRKKARLNHVSFNAHHPILIVGDSRYGSVLVSISPTFFEQLIFLHQKSTNLKCKYKKAARETFE
jgi:hypothetical protein